MPLIEISCRARKAERTVTDGHVVLILFWRFQARGQLTLTTSRQNFIVRKISVRKTDNEMRRFLVSSFRLNHINLSRNAIFWCKF